MLLSKMAEEGVLKIFSKIAKEIYSKIISHEFTQQYNPVSVRYSKKKTKTDNQQKNQQDICKIFSK